MSKTQVTILGCGSSLGVPRIDNYWGNADKNNSKNCRTRCSLFIKYRNLSIIIDTSPDIKQQLLANKIRKIDAVIYTHEHADQTHGINELRPFYWINKKRIPTYSDGKTSEYLLKSFEYLFKRKSKFYNPILNNKIIKREFFIKKKLSVIKFTPIKVKHGDVYANGYRFNDVAYISDCSSIPENSLKKLKNIKLLIIDCLKFKKHKTHLNFNQCINYINIIKPKKTILTNLHSDIDY
ncbi:MAG: MBL fold metallo-hydrolase, partial [Proteobacteria bacterium]|nr:MBL fold metallo-hydrolase [Pseudomonadota bacterium]